MKKVLGIFLGLIALMIVGIVGVFAFSGSTDSPLGQAASQAKAAAVNTALDVTDVRSKIEDAVVARTDDIAQATGMSSAEVSSALASLDIASWQAVALPSGAVATGTYAGTAAGVDGSITTYADPSYVTVSAYGQNITLAVPDNAQAYLPYLSTLS